MPIKNPRYRLTRAMVEGAPDDAGLFALWEDDELIYVGRATESATIRQRLDEHLERRHPCTTRATHYSWELSLRATARELELLQEHMAQFGRKPKCNESAA
jgi:hypothetical protein